MKLKTLIKNLPVHVKGSKEIAISGLCADSRRCKQGDLFIAKRGKNFDGTQYVHNALNAGAIAVLSDLYDPFCNALQLITPDVSFVEAELARRFYLDPSSQLYMVGITGTNGKTTTSYLVRHLLGSCGLIGTIEAIVGDHHFPSDLTTPDVIALQKLLSEMVQEKMEACVMEVSSHALDQGRTSGVAYDIGIFTNLTQDHLDYHQNMDNYLRAKQKLFTNLKKCAILNADCPYHKHMKTKAPILTYGIDTSADLRAFDLELSPSGIAFTLVHQKSSQRLTCPLIGRFNVSNCLAAIATAITYGLSLPTIAQRLQTFSAVPGRLEKIPNHRGLHIYVDYAHTEDALHNVLSTLREITTGRLLTLFGCGGERDQDKRPKMGSVATRHSDHIVITSDNPRGEDPHAICQDILKGCTGPHTLELDRKLAIQKLIELARPGDVLLIAGKGHERTQTFSDRINPFDDREIARQICLDPHLYTERE
ncbi:MAG: UDP-N-acetylmuramoyl-L-alanyl-D-glutamate--2,6-diaminopimelate ligase [Chlamydiales bacterium]|nr:UDP-N-acetylmuramoyl-L-alanyl-D-glutamate--2,6-diaminopimelate ligase [Chlamydiales bacterium]